MTRQEITERLTELPSGVIEQAYSLDVILGTLQLQYDSFLKGLYKSQRVADNPANPGFIYFQFGSWTVMMEKEEENH